MNDHLGTLLREELQIDIRQRFIKFFPIVSGSFMLHVCTVCGFFALFGVRKGNVTSRESNILPECHVPFEYEAMDKVSKWNVREGHFAETNTVGA
jgi:hypothetical protein